MKTTIITTRCEMEDILQRVPICYVGVTDLEGNPYVTPMNLGYSDGVIYLHSAPSGSVIDMLKVNNHGPDYRLITVKRGLRPLKSPH